MYPVLLLPDAADRNHNKDNEKIEQTDISTGCRAFFPLGCTRSLVHYEDGHIRV